jgi:hypothetical protein
MTNIGTTRGSLAYLTKVLLQIADELEERNAGFEHDGQTRTSASSAN